MEQDGGGVDALLFVPRLGLLSLGVTAAFFHLLLFYLLALVRLKHNNQSLEIMSNLQHKANII